MVSKQVLFAIMALALGIGATWVVSAFSVDDTELIRFGALCIRLQCIALPLHAWATVINMLCSGLGYAKYAFIIAISRQGTCFLPIIYPLFLLFDATGIASVQAIADVLAMLIALPIIRKVMHDVQTNLSAQLQAREETSSVSAG